MILENTLPIIIGSKQVQYYSSLGYDNVKVGETLNILNEDVLEGSGVIETRQCDICGQSYTATHRQLIKTYKRFNKDVCPHCVQTNEEIKQITKDRRAESLMQHYGVDNPSKSEDIKLQKSETLLKHYGVDNPMKNEEIRLKAQTTNIEKYGVASPAQSDIVKEKTKQTCLEKYGVEYTAQIPESREKANQSFFKHGTQKVSSQQYNIYNMLEEAGYNVILNFPLSNLSLDIYLEYNDIKLDIEYDGTYWHQDKQADRRRDEFVKSQGYKVLRIISDKKIPNLIDLENAIMELIESTHNFKQIIIN